MTTPNTPDPIDVAAREAGLSDVWEKPYLRSCCESPGNGHSGEKKLVAALSRLAAENAELRQYLSDYGTHHVECEFVSTPAFDGDKRELQCTCGYFGALNFTNKGQGQG